MGLQGEQFGDPKSCEVAPLNGQSGTIFGIRFFPQTAPPGPIRDVLGPFRFFLLLG